MLVLVCQYTGLFPRLRSFHVLSLLDFFATPAKELEEAAAPIIEKYLDMNRYRRVAGTIQVYEKMFWDAMMEY